MKTRLRSNKSLILFYSVVALWVFSFILSLVLGTPSFVPKSIFIIFFMVSLPVLTLILWYYSSESKGLREGRAFELWLFLFNVSLVPLLVVGIIMFLSVLGVV